MKAIKESGKRIVFVWSRGKHQQHAPADMTLVEAKRIAQAVHHHTRYLPAERKKESLRIRLTCWIAEQEKPVGAVEAGIILGVTAQTVRNRISDGTLDLEQVQKSPIKYSLESVMKAKESNE